jgi:hypothetical protein
MKYSISPWTQVGGTLGNVGKGKKEFFPELIHYKHSVGSIAMQEKCLGKEGEIPVKYEEQKDDSHFNLVLR